MKVARCVLSLLCLQLSATLAYSATRIDLDRDLPKQGKAGESAANDADFLMVNQYFGAWQPSYFAWAELNAPAHLDSRWTRNANGGMYRP